MNELTGLYGVSALPPVAPPVSSSDPRQMRIEFDTMILEMLIKSSGLLTALTESEEGSPLMAGEMLAYPLAKQLAEQVDLGFGSMMLRTSEVGEIEHD